jgi:signal transduction histidine kinase
MKFTPEVGSISISLSQEASPLGAGYVRNHITVSDTGIGMSEEFRKKVFNAFEREDSKRVNKIQKRICGSGELGQVGNITDFHVHLL